MQRTAIRMMFQMLGDRTHVNQDHSAHQGADGDDHEEGRVPSPAGGQQQGQRNSQHAAAGERGLNHSHDAAAHLQRKQIGDDGEGNRADDAREHAGDHPGGQQPVIARGQAAEQRADEKAAVEEQQQFLPVEAVGEPGREESRQPRAERVSRDDQSELRGRDLQRGNDQRAQGGEHHEVEHDGELQEGQNGHDEFLVTRKGVARFAGVGCFGFTLLLCPVASTDPASVTCRGSPRLRAAESPTPASSPASRS